MSSFVSGPISGTAKNGKLRYRSDLYYLTGPICVEQTKKDCYHKNLSQLGPSDLGTFILLLVVSSEHSYIVFRWRLSSYITYNFHFEFLSLFLLILH